MDDPGSGSYAPDPALWTEAFSDIVMIFDAQCRFAHVNRAAEQLLELPVAELVGRTIPELVAEGRKFFGPNQQRCMAVSQVVALALTGKAMRDDETGVVWPDGTAGVLSWSMDPIRRDGVVVGAALVMRDMTAMSNATFLSAPVGMVRVRGNGEVLEINRSMRTMLGLEGDQSFLYRPFADLVHPGDVAESNRLFAELIKGRSTQYKVEHRFLRTDGAVVWCCVSMTVPHHRVLGDDRTWYDRAIGVVEDITARKFLEAQVEARSAELEWLSRTDVLTSLPNRRHLDERLAEFTSLSARRGGELSILLFDVDRFKTINDTYGHPAGDIVLQQVGARLRQGVRAEDVVGRWGGEEFLVLAPFTDQSGALLLADRLRALVAGGPITLPDGTEITVTVSGGTASGRGGATADLLQRADGAMYAAKLAGRDRVLPAEAALRSAAVATEPKAGS